MIAITVKSEDFEGNIQETTCNFHLNKLEVTELEIKYGGFAEHVEMVLDLVERNMKRLDGGKKT